MEKNKDQNNIQDTEPSPLTTFSAEKPQDDPSQSTVDNAPSDETPCTRRSNIPIRIKPIRFCEVKNQFTDEGKALFPVAERPPRGSRAPRNMSVSRIETNANRYSELKEDKAKHTPGAYPKGAYSRTSRAMSVSRIESREVTYGGKAKSPGMPSKSAILKDSSAVIETKTNIAQDALPNQNWKRIKGKDEIKNLNRNVNQTDVNDESGICKEKELQPDLNELEHNLNQSDVIVERNILKNQTSSKPEAETNTTQDPSTVEDRRNDIEKVVDEHMHEMERNLNNSKVIGKSGILKHPSPVTETNIDMTPSDESTRTRRQSANRERSNIPILMKSVRFCEEKNSFIDVGNAMLPIANPRNFRPSRNMSVSRIETQAKRYPELIEDKAKHTRGAYPKGAYSRTSRAMSVSRIESREVTDEGKAKMLVAAPRGQYSRSVSQIDIQVGRTQAARPELKTGTKGMAQNPQATAPKKPETNRRGPNSTTIASRTMSVTRNEPQAAKNQSSHKPDRSVSAHPNRARTPINNLPKENDSNVQQSEIQNREPANTTDSQLVTVLRKILKAPKDKTAVTDKEEDRTSRITSTVQKGRNENLNRFMPEEIAAHQILPRSMTSISQTISENQMEGNQNTLEIVESKPDLRIGLRIDHEDRKNKIEKEVKVEVEDKREMEPNLNQSRVFGRNDILKDQISSKSEAETNTAQDLPPVEKELQPDLNELEYNLNQSDVIVERNILKNQTSSKPEAKTNTTQDPSTVEDRRNDIEKVVDEHMHEMERNLNNSKVIGKSDILKHPSPVTESKTNIDMTPSDESTRTRRQSANRERSNIPILMKSVRFCEEKNTFTDEGKAPLPVAQGPPKGSRAPRNMSLSRIETQAKRCPEIKGDKAKKQPVPIAGGPYSRTSRAMSVSRIESREVTDEGKARTLGAAPRGQYSRSVSQIDIQVGRTQAAKPKLKTGTEGTAQKPEATPPKKPETNRRGPNSRTVASRTMSVTRNEPQAAKNQSSDSHQSSDMTPSDESTRTGRQSANHERMNIPIPVKPMTFWEVKNPFIDEGKALLPKAVPISSRFRRNMSVSRVETKANRYPELKEDKAKQPLPGLRGSYSRTSRAMSVSRIESREVTYEGKAKSPGMPSKSAILKDSSAVIETKSNIAQDPLPNQSWKRIKAKDEIKNFNRNVNQTDVNDESGTCEVTEFKTKINHVKLTHDKLKKNDITKTIMKRKHNMNQSDVIAKRVLKDPSFSVRESIAQQSLSLLVTESKPKISWTLPNENYTQRIYKELQAHLNVKNRNLNLLDFIEKNKKGDRRNCHSSSDESKANIHQDPLAKIEWKKVRADFISNLNTLKRSVNQSNDINEWEIFNDPPSTGTDTETNIAQDSSPNSNRKTMESDIGFDLKKITSENLSDVIDKSETNLQIYVEHEIEELKGKTLTWNKEEVIDTSVVLKDSPLDEDWKKKVEKEMEMDRNLETFDVIGPSSTHLQDPVPKIELKNDVEEEVGKDSKEMDRHLETFDVIGPSSKHLQDPVPKIELKNDVGEKVGKDSKEMDRNLETFDVIGPSSTHLQDPVPKIELKNNVEKEAGKDTKEMDRNLETFDVIGPSSTHLQDPVPKIELKNDVEEEVGKDSKEMDRNLETFDVIGPSSTHLQDPVPKIELKNDVEEEVGKDSKEMDRNLESSDFIGPSSTHPQDPVPKIELKNDVEEKVGKDTKEMDRNLETFDVIGPSSTHPQDPVPKIELKNDVEEKVGKDTKEMDRNLESSDFIGPSSTHPQDPVPKIELKNDVEEKVGKDTKEMDRNLESSDLIGPSSTHLQDPVPKIELKNDVEEEVGKDSKEMDRNLETFDVFGPSSTHPQDLVPKIELKNDVEEKVGKDTKEMDRNLETFDVIGPSSTHLQDLVPEIELKNDVEEKVGKDTKEMDRNLETFDVIGPSSTHPQDPVPKIELKNDVEEKVGKDTKEMDRNLETFDVIGPSSTHLQDPVPKIELKNDVEEKVGKDTKEMDRNLETFDVIGPSSTHPQDLVPEIELKNDVEEKVGKDTKEMDRNLETFDVIGPSSTHLQDPVPKIELKNDVEEKVGKDTKEMDRNLETFDVIGPSSTHPQDLVPEIELKNDVEEKVGKDTKEMDRNLETFDVIGPSSTHLQDPVPKIELKNDVEEKVGKDTKEMDRNLETFDVIGPSSAHLQDPVPKIELKNNVEKEVGKDTKEMDRNLESSDFIGPSSTHPQDPVPKIELKNDVEEEVGKDSKEMDRNLETFDVIGPSSAHLQDPVPEIELKNDVEEKVGKDTKEMDRHLETFDVIGPSSTHLQDPVPKIELKNDVEEEVGKDSKEMDRHLETFDVIGPSSTHLQDPVPKIELKNDVEEEVGKDSKEMDRNLETFDVIGPSSTHLQDPVPKIELKNDVEEKVGKDTKEMDRNLETFDVIGPSSTHLQDPVPKIELKNDVEEEVGKDSKEMDRHLETFDVIGPSSTHLQDLVPKIELKNDVEEKVGKDTKEMDRNLETFDVIGPSSTHLQDPVPKIELKNDVEEEVGKDSKEMDRHLETFDVIGPSSTHLQDPVPKIELKNDVEEEVGKDSKEMDRHLETFDVIGPSSTHLQDPVPKIELKNDVEEEVGKDSKEMDRNLETFDVIGPSSTHLQDPVPKIELKNDVEEEVGKDSKEMDRHLETFDVIGPSSTHLQDPVPKIELKNDVEEEVGKDSKEMDRHLETFDVIGPSSTHLQDPVPKIELKNDVEEEVGKDSKEMDRNLESSDFIGPSSTHPQDPVPKIELKNDVEEEVGKDSKEMDRNLETFDVIGPSSTHLQDPVPKIELKNDVEEKVGKDTKEMDRNLETFDVIGPSSTHLQDPVPKIELKNDVEEEVGKDTKEMDRNLESSDFIGPSSTHPQDPVPKIELKNDVEEKVGKDTKEMDRNLESSDLIGPSSTHVFDKRKCRFTMNSLATELNRIIGTEIEVKQNKILVEEEQSQLEYVEPKQNLESPTLDNYPIREKAQSTPNDWNKCRFPPKSETEAHKKNIFKLKQSKLEYVAPKQNWETPTASIHPILGKPQTTPDVWNKWRCPTKSETGVPSRSEVTDTREKVEDRTKLENVEPKQNFETPTASIHPTWGKPQTTPVVWNKWRCPTKSETGVPSRSEVTDTREKVEDRTKLENVEPKQNFETPTVSIHPSWEKPQTTPDVWNKWRCPTNSETKAQKEKIFKLKQSKLEYVAPKQNLETPTASIHPILGKPQSTPDVWNAWRCPTKSESGGLCRSEVTDTLTGEFVEDQTKLENVAPKQNLETPTASIHPIWGKPQTTPDVWNTWRCPTKSETGGPRQNEVTEHSNKSFNIVQFADPEKKKVLKSDVMRKESDNPLGKFKGPPKRAYHQNPEQEWESRKRLGSLTLMELNNEIVSSQCSKDHTEQPIYRALGEDQMNSEYVKPKPSFKYVEPKQNLETPKLKGLSSETSLRPMTEKELIFAKNLASVPVLQMKKEVISPRRKALDAINSKTNSIMEGFSKVYDKIGNIKLGISDSDGNILDVVPEKQKDAIESDSVNKMEPLSSTKCLCMRPMSGLKCRKCSKICYGRIARVCDMHPDREFEGDLKSCPICKAPTNNLKLSNEPLRTSDDDSDL
ncbi:microtubule-associated protein futsch-like isoform X3 [Drosophila bipectinata]|uniref:microtubule-associated protein futsch-like isoform X3 n=1 Tax=Drosophila bipectinata TaxID=42026 RepID=UPI0038B2F93E